MKALLNHHVVRSLGTAGLVAAGFSAWLLAHDAMAKPGRDVAVMPAELVRETPRKGASSKPPRGTTPAANVAVVRLEAVANMAKAWAFQGMPAEAKAKAEASHGGAPARGTVNINTATVEELQRLPGVGPSKAALIVAWRARHREFRRPVDLRRVKGIGYKTFKKLEPYLAVSGDTTLRGR